VTYHRYFDVFDDAGTSTMLLVDAGHYETEKVTQDLLAGFLSQSFPDLSVQITRHRTGPMRHYIGEGTSSSP
ncbi:MAG: NGG1p interacting factor NIF3, partial [Rhodothermales bacterium]|nr:NGG1p interacting factor NIF3 [Rhodothermales bacterium]